jgi:predicted Fe-Mo cluster-binding NifX family protein
MKVAVASLGTVPEALVGIRFGACSQFLVFDLDTMLYVVVSVPPYLQPEEHVSLEAIRAVARQDVSAVITGAIKDTCRRTLEELGIDVVSGVQGMTVIERTRATRLAAPESRQGPIVRIAVASKGEGMDARLETGFGGCTSFTIVNPQTKEWDVVRVEHGAAGPGGVHRTRGHLRARGALSGRRSPGTTMCSRQSTNPARRRRMPGGAAVSRRPGRSAARRG